MAKKATKQKKTRRKRQAQARRTGTALAEPKRKVEDLAELSEEGQALAFEIAANRSAILKLGQIALDHEARIGTLEDTLKDLAGVGEGEGDIVDLEVEPEDEEEAQRLLGLPAIFGHSGQKAKAKSNKAKSKSKGKVKKR